MMKMTLRSAILPLLLSGAAALSACGSTGAGETNVSANGADTNSAQAAAPAAWRDGLAIQLYSFHKDLDKDLAGTLKRIKALGFDRVETYPVEGVTPAQLREALDAAGLKAVSAHMPWDRIKSDPQGVVADVKTIGAEQFGPGSINMFNGQPFRSMNMAEAQEAGEALKRACAAAQSAGMRVFIHTHGNEFGPIGNTTPLERMSQEAQNCFEIEADLTWVKWSGNDPAALIRQYGPRVTSLHLKDVTAAAIGKEPGQIAEENFPVLGRGSIDWPAVMEASRAAGVRHYIIEDESADPAGQIPHSLRYLDSLSGG